MSSRTRQQQRTAGVLADTQSDIMCIIGVTTLFGRVSHYRWIAAQYAPGTGFRTTLGIVLSGSSQKGLIMTTEPLDKAASGIRTALGLTGLISVILGILVLVWPGKTAMVVTAIVAVWTIVAGLVYIGIGLFAAGKGGWARLGHILLGVLFIIAGVVAFANLGATTAWLAVFLGILVGILWIFEGIVSLSTLDLAPSKGWTIFFAIISIIAGITLLFSPLWGAIVLWWLLGISAIILGIVNIIRAFSFGK